MTDIRLFDVDSGDKGGEVGEEIGLPNGGVASGTIGESA